MLLLPWSICSFQPLAHLVEGGCVDLTARIPLAEYVHGGRLSWRRSILVVRPIVVRRMQASTAGPAYNARDEERQDDDPENLAQQQKR